MEPSEADAARPVAVPAQAVAQIRPVAQCP